MRHSITSLFILTAASSFAAILTPQQALQRAYSESEGPNRMPGIGEITLVETFKSPSGMPGVYFFKDSGSGWMVVSASDATDALLGYGDSYADDTAMPPQMQWWLSQYVGQVAYSDSIAALYTAQAFGTDEDRTSQDPAKARPKPIPPLMKTQWNQSHPYNLYSPVVNGQRTPTGCVATAMAQVMKYHNYPPEAKGSGSATAGGEEFFMDIDRPISWADMLDTYTSGNYTDTEAEAVADFMLFTGYAVKMQYAPGGSGAYNVDANRAFVENFSYAPSAWAYYRDHYTTDVWKNMLYEELANNRPIYYSGYSSSAGHAFVCDGVNVLGFFHFNWGWGGSYDGYFKIDALNPSGQGIGGSSGGYNDGQVAFLGVMPPTGDEKMPTVRLSAEEPMTYSVTDGSMVNLYGGWYNMSYVDTDFSIALRLRNITTGETWYSEPIQEMLLPYYGYDELDFDISSFSGSDGDYTAKLMTCTAIDPEWLPVQYPYWEDEHIYLTKTGDLWQTREPGGVDSVHQVSSPSGTYDVYTTTGTMLLHDASDSDVKSHSPDLYILRNGNKAVKTKLNR